MFPTEGDIIPIPKQNPKIHVFYERKHFKYHFTLSTAQLVWRVVSSSPPIMASKASKLGKIGAIVLTEAQVKSLLAHRHRYLFVRHAIHNDIGKSITTVPQFPSHHFLPPNLQILEALGQTSALLIRQVWKQHNKNSLHYSKIVSFCLTNQFL